MKKYHGKNNLTITVIHGQSHKGSTYNITKQIVDNIPALNKQVHEYFMPTDGPDFCIGCYKCFNDGEGFCPHSDKVQRIVGSMMESQLIIIDSPTYCYGMTGQLKTLLDHFGYMWLPHRPKGAMFDKVAVAVSTAAGAGASKVTESLAHQLFWLGIPKVFRYSKNVKASKWEDAPRDVKESVKKDTLKISKQVGSKIGKARPNYKLKIMFNMMRLSQKMNNWNMLDKNYWDENGWLDKKRPW